LREQIFWCSCEPCRAIVRLVEHHGANLQFSLARAGRLCELVIVVGAGADGIAARDVVPERRKYASHLELELTGQISNCADPIHICHAIDHSNHNSQARNRINIGSARASYSQGRFYLL